MEALFYIVIGLLTALVLFSLGWWSALKWHGASLDSGSAEICADQPRVIVNMPADAKILPQMAGDKVIAGERAVLWYSVYCKAMENGYKDYAADDANQAVVSVFGHS